MMNFERTRPWRFLSDGDGGGGTSTEDPPAAAAGDGAASDPPPAAAAAASDDDLPDDVLDRALKKRNYVAMPSSTYQELDTAAKASKAAPAKKEEPDEDEDAALTEQFLANPGAAIKTIVNRSVTEAVTQTVNHTRDMSSLPGKIMADVRARCPGLPEEEYASIEALCYQDGVTPAMLKTSLQKGDLVQLAKAKKLDLIENGKLEVKRASRPANAPDPVNGDVATEKPARTSKAVDEGAQKLANALASQLGITSDEAVKSIKGSSYMNKG